MPKFVFQLEGLLKHRKRMEQDRQRIMAERAAQMSRLQSELRELNQTVQRAGAEMRSGHLTGELDMDYLSAHRRFMLATQRKALALVQKMALVQRQVDEAQRDLAEAAKQRKIVEKLRQRHRDRWMQALARRELSELDEIGMQLSYWYSDSDDDADDVAALAASGGAGAHDDADDGYDGAERADVSGDVD
jgi:flagellar FliJ protein